jgi:DNA-binding response OmpR family regulator
VPRDVEKLQRTRGAPPVILVIEDDVDIVFLVRFILERERYTVEIASDGREAMARLDDSPPSLVLLDIMLPFTDGFQLLELIRAQPAWAGVPIVMLTAKSQERDCVRALNAGANDYIVKPFRPEELVARVRRLLGRAE